MINGKTATIDASNGLPVFDLEFAGEITNESGVDLTLTVGAGELQAADWKDMYLLMNYEVEALRTTALGASPEADARAASSTVWRSI